MKNHPKDPVSVCATFLSIHIHERLWLSCMCETEYEFACRQTLWGRILVFGTTHTLPTCMRVRGHMCMLLWHIESIPKLCLLQCRRGLGGHSSIFLVSAAGHSYGDPVWQSLPNPGGRTRLIGSEQIWGRAEMKDKEVCAREWILLMSLRCTLAWCHCGTIHGRTKSDVWGNAHVPSQTWAQGRGLNWKIKLSAAACFQNTLCACAPLIMWLKYQCPYLSVCVFVGWVCFSSSSLSSKAL